MGGDASRQDGTVLTFSPAARVLVLFGPATLGALIGFALPMAARWLADVGFPVLGVVWRVAASVDTWWKAAVQAAILAVVGVLVSAEIVQRSTRITVGSGEVRLRTGDSEVVLARPEIGALFVEGDTLVILDRESRQVFRGEPQADAGVLERAFRDHGYPWRTGDPFADLYQRWIPESGHLPVAVDAVLTARSVAVRRKAAKEAAELRGSLEKLGYAVRDDGAHQLWRPLVRS
ncbi:hypothetical protein Aca07nite_76300 [Actinoplanes capillaceus]|uniref:Uncharacterized protein n=1 Tax=Actinoplanes campanulatus TaxID=113559 RepID=A0ABQ3WW39_9ACTN|nr:hypothetical protein [Actinoplanes capillaceus]GID50355.1 hypothetical protein Aca07nite_76300 [Actinoplanes capillaceus]